MFVTARMKTGPRPQTFRIAMALLLTFAVPATLMVVAQVRIHALVPNAAETPHMGGAVR